jgi:hypothetical protein
MMTLAQGLGMLAMGMTALAIAGIIIFKVINYKKREENNDD